MPIPKRSEESAHNIFLKYQIAMEKAIADLHKNVSMTLTNIISRNTNADGTVNKAKIKLIVDKYMTQELKQYRIDLMNQIRTGVADGANQGVRAVIGAVAPNRNVTADKWVNLSKSIRKNIVNLKSVDGITLSERVWKMTNDNTYNLKRIISSDIFQGKGADEISRNIRKYLVQPETLRGRVKAEARPGQGVYKSAYKNAVRVARTETNRAYVDGQKLTTAGMGYKMELRIAGINVCDICAGLNGNVYEPSDFPAPVHPNCMCYSLTVPAD